MKAKLRTYMDYNSFDDSTITVDPRLNLSNNLKEEYKKGFCPLIQKNQKIIIDPFLQEYELLKLKLGIYECSDYRFI